jgi:peptidoglycan hydrolase-like protein with peptidoglycan-binding domain
MENNVPLRSLGKRDPSRKSAVAFKDFVYSFPPAPIVDMAPLLNYPMDGNDSVGDCVVAGFDHFNQIITSLLTGVQMNLNQEKIWELYKTQNPNFDPNGTASTNGPGSNSDNGMDIQTFLNYLALNKYILAFAKIDHTNEEEMKAATYLGLSIITGVQLQSAQEGQQFNQGVWDYDSSSSVLGGHCIPLVGYQATPDTMTCVTWGKLIDCTQNFISRQMDEAWFVLTQAHVDHPEFRNHFDISGFSTAVSEITQGKVIIPVPTILPTKFTRTLRVGMRGDDVKFLQTLLKINSDGIFGAHTLTSVEAFQLTHGLAVDGIVGPKTQASLLGLVNPVQDTHVTIVRQPSDANETKGTLTVGSFSCDTLERGNQGVLCIPPGTYKAIWSHQNDLNEDHYELQNVPGRTGIFIHEGNYYSDSVGCILLGSSFADINGDGEQDVTSSRATLSQFEALFNKAPITITIS